MSERFQADVDRWDDVAALVRDAGDYVDCSPQLRPRVVEAVRRVSVRRRGVQQFAGVAILALALAAALALVVAPHLTSLAPPQGVTAEQLDRRAGERAAAAGVGFDWALSEVVADWRSQMAGSPPTLSVFQPPAADG